MTDRLLIDVSAHVARTADALAGGSVLATAFANFYVKVSRPDAGTDLLHITSANRSRQRTGAAQEPAHWRAVGIAAEFPGFVLVRHRDEARAGVLPRLRADGVVSARRARVRGSGRKARRVTGCNGVPAGHERTGWPA
jgi:hypothetical protein